MSPVRLDRRAALLAGGLVALLAVAVPVIAADHTASPGAPEQGQGQRGQGNKAEKGPEIKTTLSGLVEQTVDEKGRPTFTITSEGAVWELSAGPKWFYGDNNPLTAWVGQSVEVAGTYREGATELDVDTVNGERLRAEGKPPWAGGPRVVGEAHPGWKAWKAEGAAGNGLGREGAPGQQKDKTGAEDDGGG